VLASFKIGKLSADVLPAISEGLFFSTSVQKR